MARHSLSPMRDMGFAENSTSTEEVVTPVRVGRKRKDAPMTHLKYLRQKSGYTLESLSAITNVSISYLSRLESGTRRLNTDLIRRLSIAFNCSPAELLQEISHDGNVVTSVEFGRKRRPELLGRDTSMPLYQIAPSEDDPEKLTISICQSNEWKIRPSELMGHSKVFALKSESRFEPYFSATATLYMEQASNLTPEATVVVLDRGQVMIKKVWSMTPTSLQLCDISDIDALKKGEKPHNELVNVDREKLDAVYRVVGYSDFWLD